MKKEIISIEQARDFFEVDGIKPHKGTILRWHRIGLCKGKVKLKCFNYGRRLVTTIEYCEQFVTDLSVEGK